MRKKQMDFCKKMICILLLGMLCFWGACSNQSGEKESSFGNKDNLPEDTPWNHGISAIMETEQGWYTTGLGEDIGLRYYEKGTKNTILLCNKPECEHQGDDTCEATYRHLKVVNACLYEGYIYLMGWEGVCNDAQDIYERDIPETEIADSINLSLYRAALDGSAIDKVATLFETDNMQHQRVNRSRRTAGLLIYEHDETCFIIHKGVAYVPVYLQLGEGSVGFRGAGLYKVDLSTGMVGEIEHYENLQSRIPAYLSGISDYVYYFRYDGAAGKQLWYRYVISENRVEKADPKFSETATENEAFGKHFVVIARSPVFTAEREYFLVRTFQEREAGVLAILAVDAKTQEVISEESFETQIPFNKSEYRLNKRMGGYYSMLLYDGRFLITDGEGIYFYDLQGNGFAQDSVMKIIGSESNIEYRLDYKICNEKLYLIYQKEYNELGFGDLQNYYRVWSCPLEELWQGQGDWTYDYRFQGVKTWEDVLWEKEEDFEIKMLSGYENMTEEQEKDFQEWIEQRRERIRQILLEEK